MKYQNTRKIISFISCFSLILQTFLPLTFAMPVYADDATDSAVVEVTPTPEITPEVTPEVTITPEPTSATPTPTVEVTPTVEPTPEITPEVTPEPVPTPEVSPEITSEPTPTNTPSQWTFEKVELNKEYVSPQNSEVKLTFTKLPDPSGNIKIEEITLTQEQIQQTGSLSDKAYDITSDMTDGSFSYNLSLPIPEASKGKAVEVKFAEELSNIGTAEKVENTLTKTDTSVSVTSLDHFTIFVVTNLYPSWVAVGGGGVYSAYYGWLSQTDITAVAVSPGSTAIYDGLEVGIIKAGQGSLQWDEGLFGFKPTVTIDAFAISPVTYDVQNQFGVNPVWMTIEIDTGSTGEANRSDNTVFQFVPAAYPTG